jgi:hypothetical protein
VTLSTVLQPADFSMVVLQVHRELKTGLMSVDELYDSTITPTTAGGDSAKEQGELVSLARLFQGAKH